MSDPRYPIGKFRAPEVFTSESYAEFIEQIAETPAKLRQAVSALSEEQLDEPYREGGWTVRQVVHHLADSHLNAYVRFKLGITEEKPTIKPYDQERWAVLADASSGDVSTSLSLLEALHERWVVFLRSLDEKDFSRKIRHPEHGDVGLDWMLALYAWHGRHHVAHVRALRERIGQSV